MGRLHSNGKGISASALPYSRTPPAWLKTTPEQGESNSFLPPWNSPVDFNELRWYWNSVVDQICKLAKKGATPSQIGVVLRDSHGIAQVKVVTGMSGVKCSVMEEDAYLWSQVTRFSESSSPMVRFPRHRPDHHWAWSNDVFHTKHKYASAWSLTDGVIITGLAPEIPEDLYMLIKKVRGSYSSVTAVC